MNHSLQLLSETYLNYKPATIEEISGKKVKEQIELSDLNVKDMAQYSGELSDITFQLAHHFKNEMVETEKLKWGASVGLDEE